MDLCLCLPPLSKYWPMESWWRIHISWTSLILTVFRSNSIVLDMTLMDLFTYHPFTQIKSAIFFQLLLHIHLYQLSSQLSGFIFSAFRSNLDLWWVSNDLLDQRLCMRLCGDKHAERVDVSVVVLMTLVACRTTTVLIVWLPRHMKQASLQNDGEYSPMIDMYTLVRTQHFLWRQQHNDCDATHTRAWFKGPYHEPVYGVEHYPPIRVNHHFGGARIHWRYLLGNNTSLFQHGGWPMAATINEAIHLANKAVSMAEVTSLIHQRVKWQHWYLMTVQLVVKPEQRQRHHHAWLSVSVTHSVAPWTWGFWGIGR